MAPTRKALLIYSDNCDEVQILDSRIRRFMYSTFGGGWRPSEIITMLAPSTLDVHSLVNEQVVDYSLIFFFGETFIDQNNNRFLVLEGGDYMHASELHALSAKQLFCIHPFISNMELPMVNIGTNYERIVSRNLYNNWIKKSQAGRVTCVFSDESFSTTNSAIFQMFNEASKVDSKLTKVQYNTFLVISLSAFSKIRAMGAKNSVQVQVTGSPGLPFSMLLPSQRSNKRAEPFSSSSLFKKFTSFFNTHVNSNF